MRILYYYWDENSFQDMHDTLVSLGHNVITLHYQLQDFFFDAILEKNLHELLRQNSFSFLYSFNFFPVLSKIAQENNLPYVCWIYDCPHSTLYSEEAKNDCNYIFHFDKNVVQNCRKRGIKHAFHLPLAVNKARLSNLLQKSPFMSYNDFSDINYIYDISFVGSLYEQCLYNAIRYLPEHLQGFLDGVIATQKSLWGCNLVSPLLTDEIQTEFFQHVKFNTITGYFYPSKELMADLLFAKITSDERIEYLNFLSSMHNCTIFSGSDVASLCPNANAGGYISYLETMPHIFHNSKININISLRSITSGIPLRCIDILGAGGFLLSNYQPELDEYFKDGVDFVCYHSLSELSELAGYYLNHDEERKRISYNAYINACNHFSYDKQVNHLLSQLPL